MSLKSSAQFLVVLACAGALVATPATAAEVPTGLADVRVAAGFDPNTVVSQTPQRLADVSNVTPGVVRCYNVAGSAGVPANAVGVMLNVTAAQPAGPGNALVYPDTSLNGATPAPNASTVNFESGKDVANAAIVALPSNGDVCTFVQGSTAGRLILDVTGYILPNSGVTMTAPVRVLDTRSASLVTPPSPAYANPITAGPVPASQPRSFQVTGTIPSDTVAVLVNVTVTNVQKPGNLKMWAANSDMPDTSVLNYAPGQDKANFQLVAISSPIFGDPTTGAITILSDTVAGYGVDVIVDVVGYVSSESFLQPVFPERGYDTRVNGNRQAIAANGKFVLTGIPTMYKALILNVTVVGPTGNGHLRVYPAQLGLSETPPDTSSINYIPGRDIPNTVVVKIPASGMIGFYNVQSPGNSTHLVVDIVGVVY